MQILDYILLALIILAAALAVRRILRDRRAGKCCCGAVQICDLGNSACRSQEERASADPAGICEAHARDARESCMQSMCDERLAAYCGNCAGCTAHCSAACTVYGDTTGDPDAARAAHVDAANTARCTQNINHRAG